jgi:hypothetical protein
LELAVTQVKNRNVNVNRASDLITLKQELPSITSPQDLLPSHLNVDFLRTKVQHRLKMSIPVLVEEPVDFRDLEILIQLSDKLKIDR